MATKVIVKKVKEDFSWGRFKVSAAPYVFISPFYLFFLVFGTIPIIFSLFLSFQNWNGIREMEFAGIHNYIKIISDQRFWDALGRTILLLFMGAIPTQIMALFFAFVLNSTFVKGKEVFKGVFFLPYVTSTVAISLIFGLLYGVNYGLFNYILESPIMKALLPIKTPVLWLSGWSTLFSLTILAVWRWVGWTSILYLSGLQSISKSYYEAAMVDGASWAQIFFKITLPLLAPIIFFNLTMAIIGGMQSFDEASVLLGKSGSAMGGVDYSGVTVAIYLYNQGFASGFYGKAAAVSYILMIIILLESRILTFIFKQRD